MSEYSRLKSRRQQPLCRAVKIYEVCRQGIHKKLLERHQWIFCDSILNIVKRVAQFGLDQR